MIELANAVIASHAAAICWAEGTDRERIMDDILQPRHPNDRCYPCHGHMDCGDLPIVGAKWKPSKEIQAGLNMLAQLWLADYAEHGTRWFDGTPLVQQRVDAG